jgi:hypothetical protein
MILSEEYGDMGAECGRFGGDFDMVDFWVAIGERWRKCRFL